MDGTAPTDHPPSAHQVAARGSSRHGKVRGLGGKGTNDRRPPGKRAPHPPPPLTLSTCPGGHRVPAIFVWPGRIPAGVVSSALVSHTDLVPTVAAIVGLKLPNRHYDGVDLSPLLFAAEPDPDPYALRSSLVHVGNDGTVQAVRVGDYKLFLSEWRYRRSRWPPAHLPNFQAHAVPQTVVRSTPSVPTTITAQRTCSTWLSIPPSGLLSILLFRRRSSLASRLKLRRSWLSGP